MTLDCFVCGKTLPPAMNLAEDPSGQLNPPHGGTQFNSRGNYGSFFDPSITSTEFMEINICNACLLGAAQVGRVAYGRTVVEARVEYETFDLKRFT